ncbi:MAG: CRTAC1 family protein [Candidatus Wenzhouxiangella sp. M2_3B_020]
MKYILVLAVACIGVAFAAMDIADSDRGPVALRFVDVSDRLPVRQPIARFRSGAVDGYGPLWLDADGDRRLDLVFMNHGLWPSLFENDGRGGFVDRTESSGLKLGDWDYPQQADRHGATCADFGNDGRPDLHIAHGASRGDTLGDKRDELLENRGGYRFRDVVKPAGVANPAGRARVGSWADFDLDGRIDLYVANYRSANVLYRNLGGGRFAEADDRLQAGRQSHHAAWSDYDGDGDPDLLELAPLRLLRNDGARGFVDVTKEAGLRGLGLRPPRGIAWRDFDNDGDPDVFIPAKHTSGRLMVNEDGRFRPLDPMLEWGHGDGSSGNGAVWGDVDNDGWPDLLLTRSDGLALYINERGRGFRRESFAISERYEMGHSGEAAFGDYDRDGFLDVAFNALGSNHLFRNTGGEGSWLALDFEGRASNRMGFGVRVTADVLQGDGSTLRVQRQYFGDNGVFRSVGCGPLHLGLGDAERVDLTIRWPSGRVQRLDDVEIDRWMTVAEPAD